MLQTLGWTWPSFCSCRTEWEETQARGLASEVLSFHFSKCLALWEQLWFSPLIQHLELCLLSAPGKPRMHTLTHAWVPRAGVLHCMEAQEACCLLSGGRLMEIGHRIMDKHIPDLFPPLFLTTLVMRRSRLQTGCYSAQALYSHS